MSLVLQLIDLSINSKYSTTIDGTIGTGATIDGSGTWGRGTAGSGGSGGSGGSVVE